MVALVKLEGLEKRKPDQLSGGQKQRVALARALARRPQILLLDEPLAALDKKLRESTQAELMELQRRLGTTFIIVTHDQEEAMTMADRIGVMDAGRLEQVATPRELYEAPASRWIAEFVGDINLFEGEVASREAGRLTIATRDAGTIVVAAPRAAGHAKPWSASRSAPKRSSCRAAVRLPTTPSHAHAINRLEGVVTDVSYLGGLTTYKVKLDSGAVLRSSMANTARIDIDAYSAEPARGGLVHARRLPGAGAMSARRIFAASRALRRDRAVSVDGAVLPGAVRLRAEDQPVADRDGAAALSAGVRLHAGSGSASRPPSPHCRWTISGCWSRDNLYVLSYLRSLVVAAVSTAILLADRLSHRLRHGAAAAALAGDRDDAGDRAVLDLVPDPRSMPGSTSCSTTACSTTILLALHLVSTPVVWLSTDSAMYIGIVYSYLPFMILPLYATLAKMDPALLEAAADLGASPLSRRSGW